MKDPRISDHELAQINAVRNDWVIQAEPQAAATREYGVKPRMGELTCEDSAKVQTTAPWRL
jgi:hypothetical protein